MFDNISLDPRSERVLTREAKIRAFELSGGSINSFAEGDPLDVLIRTQAYTGAEFLFWLNKLPLAFALKFLSITTQDSRKLGAKATGMVRFTLVAPRSAPFYVPAAFQLLGSDSRGSLRYVTTDELVIQPGEISGDVRVDALEIGRRFNLVAGRVNKATQPLAFLKSVANIENMEGGEEPEGADVALDRAVASLRRRAPISTSDYEEYAQEVLGGSSRCIAIGLLGLDKLTYEKGAVHLFCLGPDSKPANSAQLAKVRAALNPKIQLGTRLHLSPVSSLPIEATIIVQLQEGADPGVIADDLWSSLQGYLNPSSYPVGQSVDPNEWAHQARFTDGLKYIEDLIFNQSSSVLPLPTDFTLPFAYSLSLTLVTSGGAAIELLRGAGEPVGSTYQV